MRRNNVIAIETKLDVVRRCMAGSTNPNHEATLLGVDRSSICDWIENYKSLGIGGLTKQIRNTRYTDEFKINAVTDYLSSTNSYRSICNKYKIRSTRQLRDWVKLYNSHESINTSRSGGLTIMTKGRKTLFEERIEIVEYCIEMGNDYSKVADKFNVSYQQVYTWMKKYKSSGVEGLRDKRGRTKPLEEMNELEQIKVQNRLLKAENQSQKMELEFLKKLEEIKRRRY